MNAFLPALGGLTDRLLKVSIQASLVIGVVLLVQGLAGRRLSPRARYALWLVVVLRLLLPVSLESGFSLFNFTRAASAKVFQAVGAAWNVSAAKVETNRAPAPTPPVASASAPTASGVAPVAVTAATPAVGPATASPPRAGALSRAPVTLPGKSFPWAGVLSTVWLAGVIFLLARIVWIPLRLNARLARHETPTAPGVFEILEESKRLSGVNQVLPIVQSRAVESPALLGFIRPWLLLPEGLVARFTAQELRLVFLHELAHLKRRDIAVNWLTTLLQILHWPNPLVWLAFARMRADRELACDELALSFARDGEGRAYGHAIIKLLEGFRRPAALPGLVGILEDQTQMQKRITMIAQFKKMTGWSTAAAGLVVGIGIVTLTDAQTEKGIEPARIYGANGPAVKTLVSGTSDDAYGILAPDESAIAYTSWSSVGGDLALRNLRTGETKILAAASRQKGSYDFAMNFAWAPDSQSIAYEWSDEDGESVRIVSRGGGAPKIVKTDKDGGFWPSDWSRDGRFLVGEGLGWGQNVKPPELSLLNIATGEIRSLGSAAAHARFSPDGKWVVCERTTNGNRDVVVVSTDDAHATRLTTSPAEDGCPVFAPDGRSVLFGSNQRGTWDLWSVRVENGMAVGPAQPVRYDFGDHHKWITSSGRLAFNSSGSGIDNVIWTDVFEIAATRSVPEGDRGPRAIARGVIGRNVHPAWSPDGKKIAYVRFRGPGSWNPLLCVQSLADGVDQVYEPGMRRIARLYWSPDGQTIAMRGIGDERSGGPGMYFFSLANRERTADQVVAGWGLGFSGDGKEFFFMDQKSKERLAVNIATKAQRKTPSPSTIPNVTALQNVIWDESVAVYVAKEGTEQQLIVADADLKNKRVVARVQEPAAIRFPSLSPDRTKVAFHVDPTGESNRKQLHVAATDGSWDRIVDTGEKYAASAPPPSWSPDSARFVLTLREDLPGEIGVLENFLPAEKLVAK